MNNIPQEEPEQETPAQIDNVEEGAAGSATGGDFTKEDKRCTEAQTVSHKDSRVLKAWLNSPRVAMELGRDVLMDLKATTELKVHVGLSYCTANHQ